MHMNAQSYYQTYDCKRRRLLPPETAQLPTRSQSSSPFAHDHEFDWPSTLTPETSTYVETPAATSQDDSASFPAREDEINLQTGAYPAQQQELVCLGMIVDLSLTQYDRPNDRHHTPVYLRDNAVFAFSTHEQIACLSDHGKAVLDALTEQGNIKVQTYMAWSRQQPRNIPHHTSTTKPTPRLCVILYGMYADCDDIGRALDACSIFLQDPEHCDRNVPYYNPHRLREFGDEVLMTFDLCVRNLEPESYQEPGDILSELETKEGLRETPTPTALKTGLLGHQMQALTFMHDRERAISSSAQCNRIWTTAGFGGRTRYINNITGEETFDRPMNCPGGIIADVMGLGKTLTAIALVASDLDARDQPLTAPHQCIAVQTTLVVVRAPLLKTWECQLSQHLKEDSVAWSYHHGKNRLVSTDDLARLNIVLTTYHTLLKESKRPPNSRSPLYSVTWRRIILDEAHDIRVQKSATFEAVSRLEACSRWAITGTPIQNRLLDLASLFQFLRLQFSEYYTTFQALTNHLVSRHGQEHAAQKLRQLVQCVMLRRSLATVTLPERSDMVCRLEFNPDEAKLYTDLKEATLAVDTVEGEMLSTGCSVLQMFTQLRMVCNLGTLQKQRGQKPTCWNGSRWSPERAQELFDELIASGRALCSTCHTALDAVTTDAGDNAREDSGRPSIFPCHWLCGPCCGRNESCPCVPHAGHSGIEVSMLSKSTTSKNKFELNEANTPTKIRALICDLKAHVGTEKCIVLSFWTSTLDVIEQALSINGICCIRFDGTITQSKRNKNLASFSEDHSVRVALLTISCGAVGLDLTAASRAYLMEPQWNPSVEQQALARVHRMGQQRPVTTIRYIIKDTLEEHVLKVQHEKQMLSQLLLSETHSGSASRAELLKSML